MTDNLVLFEYRLNQAEITLSDAKKMLDEFVSNHSIVNRAYYSMFYMVLALFLQMNVDVKTSKHTGVISIFDREFVLSGKIDKKYSKMLHQMFDDRQEFDYKELVVVTKEDAKKSITYAEDFINALKKFIYESETKKNKNSNGNE